MTYVHVFCEHIIHNIVVRKEVLDIKNNWDIAVLVVKDVNPISCVEFAYDGSIFNGKMLLHVGHSSDLVWSAFVGRVAYSCVNTLVHLSDDGEKCGVMFVLVSRQCHLIE